MSKNIKLNSLKGQDGSAIVIALLIMTLLLAFVAIAVSRTSNETITTYNDETETRTFLAAQSGLETMTRNFDKIFDVKLNPSAADITNVESLDPQEFNTNAGFPNTRLRDYDYTQRIEPSSTPKTVVLAGQFLQGLNALRDEWKLTSTATDRNTGVQVSLVRKFYNNRVPIFQFGIFYDHDLEFHPGPRFDFGGKVHSNGNLFLMAGTGLYFSSRVSAVGEVFTDVARNGTPASHWGNNVFIKNASGTYIQVTGARGSVLANPAAGAPVFASNADMPVVYNSANWLTNKGLFQGNLLAKQPKLDLPLKIASNFSGQNLDYIELIRRPKNIGIDLYNSSITSTPNITPVVPGPAADTNITSLERYANKPGIRVSLADSKAKLPGCASGSGTSAVSGPCGIRLDGDEDGDGSDPSGGDARGYQPKAMTDGYQATRLNGERFRIPGRQVWIKVETVGLNALTNTVETQDITEDFLSTGLTEAAPTISEGGTTRFQISGYGNKDSRSIIKLQRFLMPGVSISGATPSNTNMSDGNTNITGFTWNAVDYNAVVKDEWNSSSGGSWNSIDNGFADHNDHKKQAIVGDPTKTRRVVPYPIEMFDTREGLYNDSINTATTYPGGVVPWAGVMSMVDIDVANLKYFLDGNANNLFPSNGTPFSQGKSRGLKSTDIPEANGWVLYVSDRRGDYDFDGEYDMEDIYGNNDGIMQPGEDINNNGRLDADYAEEAVRYTGAGTTVAPGVAATVDHKYFRRAVRLINGQTLPGTYDSTTPSNTKGFTVASENAIYVKGNYNATGIASIGTPTPSTDFLPQNSSNIPASVVGDAVIILSNSWVDSRSFRDPFVMTNRNASETHIRFAMLSGDARSSYDGTPNQGGSDPRLTGGVHNFKRFLEDWSGVRLNYTGSLINLYNSKGNNGAFKCCTNVYSPPTRNWSFDTAFLDPNRLPPGTPFFQTIQLTGFQRVN